MARNRGLKLVRSRVRTPGKRRFGKAGLTDKNDRAVYGMDAMGPAANPADIENYLRNLGAKDWGASLDVAVMPRKKPKPIRAAANDREPENFITVFKVHPLRIVGQIRLPQAKSGIEQPLVERATFTPLAASHERERSTHSIVLIRSTVVVRRPSYEPQVTRR